MENSILDQEFDRQSQPVEPRYAGFWIRVAAYLLDVIVYLPFLLVNFYNLFELKNILLQFCIALLLMLYKPMTEFLYGATVGKMIVKIKVVNREVENINFVKAILRNSPWLVGHTMNLFSTYMLFQHPDFYDVDGMFQLAELQTSLSDSFWEQIINFIGFISCIVVAFQPQKQGLHDMLAGTWVIYKD